MAEILEFSLIGEEDINIGTGSFNVTDQAGDSRTLTKVNIDTFLLTQTDEAVLHIVGSSITQDGSFTYDDVATELKVPLIAGGSTSGGDLEIQSTSHATKGDVRIQAAGGNVGIGSVSTIDSLLHIQQDGEAILTIENNKSGASTGDAVLQFKIAGGGTFSLGLDDSDSDKFNITSSATLGTGPALTITTSDFVGIGTTTPDGTLHVFTSQGPATTPPTGADDLTIENSGDCGLTILSGAGAVAKISFTDNTVDAGYIQYDHGGAILSFQAGSAERMRFGTGTASIITSATTLPTISTDADDLVISSGGNTGITLISAAASNSTIAFGDNADGNVGRVDYDHNDNSMRFFRGDAERFSLEAATAEFITTATTIPTLNTSADDLVISNAGDVGLTLIASAGSNSIIAFGDNADADVGNINYDHNDNSMTVAVNATNRMTIEANQITMETSGASIPTVNTSLDDLIIATSGDTGISIVAGSSNVSAIGFGDSGNIDVGMISYNHTENDMRFTANTSEAMRLFRTVGGSSILFLNETTTADTGSGLVIKDAGSSAFLVAKSANVAQGFTDIVETDTYAILGQAAVAQGGFIASGYSENEVGIGLAGYYANGNTVKGTTAEAAVTMQGVKNSGTTIGPMLTNENMIAFKNGAATKAIIDADGDLHLDGTSNPSAFDDYDDVMLLETVKGISHPDFRARLGEQMQENLEILAAGKVLTLNDDGHHFISYKGMTGLLIDSIRQLNGKIESLSGEMKLLKGGTG